MSSSAWDATRRVFLPEPWHEFWIEFYLDPPMGIYLDMQKAASLALVSPTEENMTAMIGLMTGLIKAHNIVDRDGAAIEFSIRAMPASMVVGLKTAWERVMAETLNEGGGSDDPLPPPSPESRPPATSRQRASRASRSRSTTPSGDSPASSDSTRT